ncbi:hypothetical protein OESDEN_06627 [Oesophagostomum dentatum]|uniref:Uncharacterized protein n=1 Tax=Oesophagostomum dentatum TaxID=61180 RepID=A0A0B1T890_OESDE|nr:hypothetical protein OESDEN_06627 [Oesophagostomum dentatum]
MYEVVFQVLKRELAEDEKANRPAKEEPTGFAAPEWAAVLEKDGMKEGVDTVVEICASCAKQFKEGGKIVTAWTPCMEANESAWREMIGVWRTVDQTLANGAARNQFYPTSNTVRINGKLCAEIGSPESCIQFYGKYAEVGNAMYLYETIRHRVPSLQLNSIRTAEDADPTGRDVA